MPRNKDPAVLFYTSDFLVGCSALTMEERGQYITLLCLQHTTGHLSKKTMTLAVGTVSPDVLAKFRKDEHGLYFNERMDAEKEARERYMATKRAAGSKGGRAKAEAISNAKQNTSTANSNANSTGVSKNVALENENINKDISILNNIFSFSNNNNNIEMIESASAREMEDENDVVYMASDGPVTRKKLKELALESQFESQVREYFKGQYFDKDSSEPSPFISNAELFIIYNRERGWKGHGGIDLTKDDRWVAYADEWERKERLKK